MTKNKLTKLFNLDDNTKIILSVWLDLKIDGSWQETFEAVTDIKTLKEICHEMKDNENTFGMYMCNLGYDLDYNDFIEHASVQIITQDEANVLNKYNAFDTLDVEGFFACCE